MSRFVVTLSVPADGLGPFDVPSASHCCVPRVSFALPVPRNRNLSPSDLSLWAHLLSLPDLGSSQCFVLFHCMFRYSHYSVYQPFLAKMNVVFKAAPGQDIDYIIQSAIIMIRSETAVPDHSCLDTSSCICVGRLLGPLLLFYACHCIHY